MSEPEKTREFRFAVVLYAKVEDDQPIPLSIMDKCFYSLEEAMARLPALMKHNVCMLGQVNALYKGVALAAKTWAIYRADRQEWVLRPDVLALEPNGPVQSYILELSAGIAEEEGRSVAESMRTKAQQAGHILRVDFMAPNKIRCIGTDEALASVLVKVPN